LVAVVLADVAGTGLAAAMLDGQRGDGTVDLCVGGRDLIIRADGAEVNGFILTSDSYLLIGEPYAGGLGVFVSDGDGLLADQFGYVLTGLHDLGRMLTSETALAALCQDLTLSYTVQGAAGVFYGTIMQALPGDADLDGTAGYSDLTRLRGAFGMPGGAVWVDGDFNGDAVVNAVDFITLKRNFGAGGTSAPPVGVGVGVGGAAPEPGTLMILASAAAWALARPGRRMNRRRTKEKAWKTYERSER
jgi:hypothetical protein